MRPPRGSRDRLVGAVKPHVERVLVAGGGAWCARRARRGRGLILAYHNVVPEGERAAGDGSLHLAQAAFAAQLDAIVRTHDVVPLDDVLAAAGSKRPRVAITFDDAYVGAVTAGVRELVRRGLPATIFVAPGFVGGGVFWWDRVAAANRNEVPSTFRRLALEEDAGRTADVLARADAMRLPLGDPPAHARGATEDQLRVAAEQPGITLGSHSWSHPNLARLAGEQLAEELERPLAWLAERFANVSRWLAYPYGLTSESVGRAAAAAGYDAGLLVTGGWLPRRTDGARYQLPRVNIPSGLSRLGFVLRTSGLGSAR